MRILRFTTVLLLAIIAGQMSHAQEPMYSVLEAKFTIEKPSKMADSYVKTDLEGDTLSVVKVKSTLDNLTFIGNVFDRPQKVSASDGYNYYVYITEGSRSLTIGHNSYHQVVVKFPRAISNKELWEIEVIGIKVQQGDVVQVSDDNNKYSVNIDTEDFAQLYIDEEFYPNKKNIQLEEGTHYVTTKYADETYSKKVNVKENGQYIDANLGGGVIVKNASTIEITSIGNGPNPKLDNHEKKNTYEYSGMLGKYMLTGTSKFAFIKNMVNKEINVGARSSTVLGIDEMVSFGFGMFYGTHLQPLGLKFGGCRNFGWFISCNWDRRGEIDTPYGETGFTQTDENGEESEISTSTAITLATGPMFKLWRKLYMQTGVGWVLYLSTSEPQMLTADYEYKNGMSVNVELILRIRGFMAGVGYVHQFVKDAFNPEIANQLSFSIGYCM